MLFRDTLKTAYTSLQANRGRSALTMLGIVIGISSVILMVSVGQGAESIILGQIQGFGSKNLFVEPGREPHGPSAFSSIFTNSLKLEDVASLQDTSRVPHAVDAAPLVIGNTRVTYGNTEVSTTYGGTTPAMQRIMDFTIALGRFFTQEEAYSQARVAVLGEKVREELFGRSSPVGELIKIKRVTFRVVGVMKPVGSIGFQNFDDRVFVPISSAQKLLSGINHVNFIMVRADSEARVAQTKTDITLTLRERHGIQNPDNDDFHVSTQEDAAGRIGIVTDILTILLSSVAAISLIVGGIGIMNIMLVSVTERTREIGLRKAVGATNGDILAQFLTESVLLTLVGGIAGVGAGITIAYGVSLIATHALGYIWNFALPIDAVVLAFGVSAVIGLVFGIYPARRASRLNPIDALRYE